MTKNPCLRNVPAAVAAVAACLALPSLAADNTQAQLSQVKIVLVDLDPNDGIAPAISLASGGYIATWLSAPGVDQQRQQTPVAVGGALAAQRADGSHAVSFAILAGNLTGAGTGPGATASHAGTGAGGVAGEGQVIFSDFTLTPNTRIEISAVASATVAGYAGTGNSFDVWAGGGVNIFSQALQLGYASDFITAYNNAQGQGTLSQARNLFAAYDNRSSAAFSASISAVVYTGAAEAAAVPEPASAALLLAGLCGLLAMARRSGWRPS